MTLGAAKPGDIVEIQRIGGQRSFRRRLMELGLLPGAKVAFIGVAPMGDPVELCVGGSSLSIRREEAGQIEVRIASAAERTGSPAHPPATRRARLGV